MLTTLKVEIVEAAGPVQGRMQVVRVLYKLCGMFLVKAVLLVDSSNAFNSLNYQAALHNLQFLCPSLATILLNTYHNGVCLLLVCCL